MSNKITISWEDEQGERSFEFDLDRLDRLAALIGIVAADKVDTTVLRDVIRRLKEKVKSVTKKSK